MIFVSRWLVLFGILFLVGCENSPSGAAPAASEGKGVKSDDAPTTAEKPAELKLSLTPEELTDGWISLFDGESLYGWQPHGKADWQVKNGIITAGKGEPSLLCTTTQFANYVFKIDFRSTPETNSGVFLRTVPNVGPNDVDTKCYELNIAAAASNPFPTGSFVKRQKVEGDLSSTEWQTYEVTADGGHFLVKLGGKQVLDYTDPKPLARGFIGLQFNKGPIEFRNIKLKPLGLASLFNGKDLAGWKTYPNMKTECTVTPAGELRLVNGKGQLESNEKYGDFVLQLECKTNGRHLNSGVFFRCIPGEEMNGYECQIQNGYKNGDRTQPLDCGTGGIFRRQNARRVMADDFTWFHETLIADGPHMAAWVNGMQVSDFTDDRAADPNPRKGLRREPGTLMLQGHDPTTDLLFRNLRIAETPPREPNAGE